MNSDRNQPAPLRLLVLGGGAIVTECHLPALKVLGWVHGCSVVEPFERNAGEVRAKFPEVQIIQSSYEAVLEDDVAARFDAVLVALPNSLHYDACVRALQAGMHVLCEKPLAMTSQQCRQLQAAADKADRLLVVGMVRRFLPGLTALRAALAADMVGEVQRIELHDGGRFLWPSDTNTVFRKDQGGVLLGMGVHFLDYLEWLFGELKPLRYRDDCAGGIEVNCAFDLETLSAVPVTLSISWTHPLQNVMRVTGTRGSLEMAKGDLACCRWLSPDGKVVAVVNAATRFFSGDWQPTFEACFVEQFWHFAKALQGDAATRSDLVSARQASHAQELIEWAYSKQTSASAQTTVARAADRPELLPANVVVTGGTGFVGGHLVERLVELGMTRITVPVRSFRSAANVSRYPVALQRYDLCDLASCRAAVRGARHVFHLAYGTGGDAEKITVEGTRNMLEAAQLEGVESVVVFGTGTVWGQLRGVVDETSAMHPALGDYGRSKAAMHRETLARARCSAAPRISLIAPGAVYGPLGGLFCATPCELAKAGTFAWFDDGVGTCNYVHVRNLVDAAILAASVPAAHGEDFLIVDGHVTWREFLTPLVLPWLDRIPTVASASGEHSPKQERSGSLKEIFKAAMLSPQLMASLSRHPVLGRLKDQFATRLPRWHRQVQGLRPATDLIRQPSSLVPAPAMWLADIFGDVGPELQSDKARRILGWKPLVTLAEGQQESIAWLRDVVGLRP